MNLLEGKNILIVGVANKYSIASGIAKSMSDQGANLAFTFQNERLESNVKKLASSWGSDICLPCDVTNDKEISKVFNELNKEWKGLDSIIHAVGFAPSDELNGNFIDVTTREGFKIAHDVSSYSFIALAKEGKSMMLLSPILDNSLGENWAAANIVFGTGDFGTPGGTNYPDDCAEPIGDVNGDGLYDVLDIVILVNCVLAGTCGNDCSSDINGDGLYNVLDIVTLANCVLAGNCGG